MRLPEMARVVDESLHRRAGVQSSGAGSQWCLPPTALLTKVSEQSTGIQTRLEAI